MAVDRTVMEICKSALRKFNAYHPSETPEAEDIVTALECLQDMLSEWGANRLLVPVLITETFNLAVGTASYTVGQNGSPTLNTVRPEQVISAYIREGTTDSTLTLISKESYDCIEDKASTGPPEQLFVNYSSPNATFYFYPVPSSVDAFYFSSIKPMTEPTLFTQEVFVTLQIPRLYNTAVIWNLAVEICEEYGKSPSPLMMKRAQETKSNIITINAARSVFPAAVDLPSEYTGYSGYSGLDALVGR